MVTHAEDRASREAKGDAMTTDRAELVCSLQELQRDGVKVVTAGGRAVAVFHHEGNVYAVDNRCPHMGFPLHRGSVKDGVLTCHWHHAKFDLASGCTFDMFADDAARFETCVKDGNVYVDPQPIEEDRLVHWRRKLDEGLQHALSLQIAKAVIGLDELGRTTDVVRRATLFGLRHRADGWDPGLTILTALDNVISTLDVPDRALALYHGATQVAIHVEGKPPNFDLPAMDSRDVSPQRFVHWFRRFVDTRDAEAAERTLRTAIAVGVPAQDVAAMIFGAATDHLYLDNGHILDFANKAFEVLDRIGWEYAGEVLTSLVPGLVKAVRMEEQSSWRHPVDVADLLWGVHDQLDGAIESGGGRTPDWKGHGDLARFVLDSEPDDSFSEMLRLLRDGVPPAELSSAVAYAAAMRLVHFPTSNEFADWDTALHTFSFANAVDQAVRRTPATAVVRGVFAAAASVYLDRFLNVPKRPLPSPSGRNPDRDEILAAFDRQGRVDPIGQMILDALAQGRHDEIVRLLGHALLREDAGFHSFQVYEAGLRQYERFAGRPEADHILVGVARFIAAHTPTVRRRVQVFDVARRLHRKEAIYEEGVEV